MKKLRVLCAAGLLAGCVSEARDNPLDGSVAVQAPAITKVTPPKGPPGTTVTLKGTNFGSANAEVALDFGGAAVTPATRSETALVFVVPRSSPAGVTAVTLSIGGVAAEPATFAVAPVVTQLSRNAGYAGSGREVPAAGARGEREWASRRRRQPPRESRSRGWSSATPCT